MKILTGSKIFIENGNDIDYIIFGEDNIEQVKGVDYFCLSTNFSEIDEENGFYLLMTYIFYQEQKLAYTIDDIDYFKNYYEENITQLSRFFEFIKRKRPNALIDTKRYWFIGCENYLKLGETKITKDLVLQCHNEKEQRKIDAKNSPRYLDYLRAKRERECFPIINRGQLWYNTLTQEQKNELQEWYNAWLNITQTRTIPNKMGWLK